MGKALTDHGTLVGPGTEHGWFGLLRGFLPGRYGVATGKVVDSMGRQSEQVDLIICDTFYSPLLFRLADAPFVPAENVYAVFEVKQTLDKTHLDAAAGKAESVRRLHRTSALTQPRGQRQRRSSGSPTQQAAPPIVRAGPFLKVAPFRSGWQGQ